MKLIDLRSDTVTKPSVAMRKAMAEAEVGDDVYGEDPTINKLQEMASKITGKEAALYVPSGSMANQIAIKSLTEMGDEVIIGEKSHCYLYESGAGPAIAGIQFTQIGKGGHFTAEEVESSIKEDNHHYTPTTLISCENTHNRGGGKIFKLDEIKKIRAVADKHKLKMHLDGARIFNASIATGISVKEYARYFDTISFCLSKGLGAPVGSLVCSTKERVTGKLHRYRKMFGGGMRQAGILAAAGVYALEHNVERLAEDHKHAKMLARAISESKYFDLNPDEVETNIVIFSISKSYLPKISAPDMSNQFAKKGILFSSISKTAMRMVTHLDISREEIDKTITEIKSLDL
jgi:threonine aldolase